MSECPHGMADPLRCVECFENPAPVDNFLGNKMGPRKGIKHFKDITEFDETQQVVALCEHQGTMYIATTRQVWKLVDDELVPLKFVVEESD